MKSYNFGELTRKIYSFTFDHFCNSYLEYAKSSINEKSTKMTLLYVIDALLKLLHPIIPFLTEELFVMVKPFFSNSTQKNIKSIMLTHEFYPKIIELNFNKKHNDLFVIHTSVIKMIRSVKADYKLAKNQKINIIFKSKENDIVNYIKNTQQSIKKLGGVENILFDAENIKDNDKKYLTKENENFTIHFEVDTRYDIQKRIGMIKKRVMSNSVKINKFTVYLNKKIVSPKKVQKFTKIIDDLGQTNINLNTNLLFLENLLA
jgi:valyl-tRNA synthetase